MVRLGAAAGRGATEMRLPALVQDTLSNARDRLAGLTSPGGLPTGQPASARDLYSTLPQNDCDRVPTSPDKGNHWSFVDSTLFNGFTAMVICANTVVIALECQYIHDHEQQESYAVFEQVFCSIYVVEIIMRCCMQGLFGFFCSADHNQFVWNLIDFTATVVGVIGVVCDDRRTVHVNASVLRLLRVLRIVRLLRILKFMKDIEYTIVCAARSLMRMMFLVLMIDFIGAVVITQLLADSPDEVVSEMFGCLTDSMFILFNVMVDGMGAMHVPSGRADMIIITETVTQAHPHMSVFWIAFVFIGSISLMALVPAIFVELNLRDADKSRHRQIKHDWDRRVETQRAALELVFQAADKDKSHSLTRREVEDILQDKGILNQLSLDRESDDEEDDVYKEKLDIRHLRMEFSMVFDTIEAEGRKDLNCAEFIEAFRQMRAKPMDQVVVTLQQEIFKLRILMETENRRILQEIRRLADRGERDRASPDAPSPAASGRPPAAAQGGEFLAGLRVGSPLRPVPPALVQDPFDFEAFGDAAAAATLRSAIARRRERP